MTKTIAAGCVAILCVTACGSRQTTDQPLAAFEQAFDSVGSLQYVVEKPNVVYSMRRIKPLPDGILLVDLLGTNVKKIRPGLATRVIGRLGDGPGEFRAPFDAAVNDRGDVAIIDGKQGKLTVLDSTGKYLAQVKVNGAPSTLAWSDADSGYWVASSLRRGTTGTQSNGVDVFTRSAQLVRSIRKTEWQKKPLATSFVELYFRVNGDSIYSVTRTSPEVVATSLRTGGERRFGFQSAYYREPEWPLTRRVGADRRKVLSWAAKQDWITDIFLLPNQEIGVQIQSVEAHSYVLCVLDEKGQIDRQIKLRAPLYDVRGDTAFIAYQRDDTHLVVNTYRFKPVQLALGMH